jgi:hypothetical protein
LDGATTHYYSSILFFFRIKPRSLERGLILCGLFLLCFEKQNPPKFPPHAPIHLASQQKMDDCQIDIAYNPGITSTCFALFNEVGGGYHYRKPERRKRNPI